MANTTNYNWETPDDTDLVKDGAAAIRTLGSSVDTTTKALNPSTTLGDIEYRSATANTNTRLGIGTTGQVLTVAGGVPTWATSDDANAIQNAIVDAKGDIVAASAADTPARLAVGTDNQRLVAASGEATGLKYVSDTQNTVIDDAGDLLYGTAADTIGKLAIGSTGNILTVAGGVPTWAAPAGGGGITLLATTTLTGASVTVSSISGSYKNLYIVVRDFLPATDTAQFKVQLNADTNANRHGAQTTNNTSTAFDSTFIICSGEADDTVANNLTTITIPDYANTDTWKFVFTRGVVVSGSNTAQFRPFNNTGAYNQTTAISSIKYLTDGNFTSGTALLYGVS